MEKLDWIINIFCAVLGALMLYKGFYTAVGFFAKPKVFAPAPMTRKYGVVIAARNEKNVIGLLLDSLAAQTYPADCYKVFVVADNCTDETAQIAREHGAWVYERHCPEKARKGWAVEFLFENIERDFGIQSFDGFLFFDADNIVAEDYIEQMNNAFAAGCDGVIGYRNTKNFDRNCISAHYGIHFMRSSMTFHRPRSRLGFCSHIAGTGYLLSSELLKDGWHYACLTEDTQATMDFAVRGKHIEYCEAAEFYDEQPYELRVMARQRIRWAKGRLFCFFAYGYKLIYGMCKKFPKEAGGNVCVAGQAQPVTFREKVMGAATAAATWLEKLFRPVSRNFSCYDMFFYLLPNSMMLLLVDLARFIASFAVAAHFGQLALGDAAGWVIGLVGLVFGSLLSYLGSIAIGLLVVIREWRHIHCPARKLPWYLITWPLFDKLYAWLCIISLFMRVRWKPIKHDEAISIQDLTENGKPKSTK